MSVLAPERLVPAWADKLHYDDVEFITDGEYSLTMYGDPPRFWALKATSYWVHLYRGTTLVAAGYFIGKDNVVFPEGNLLGDIEVHPDHRGQRLSRQLVQMVVDRLGPVYRNGHVSVAGMANAKHLPVQMLPGHDFVVSDTVNHTLIDWSTGRWY